MIAWLRALLRRAPRYRVRYLDLPIVDDLSASAVRELSYSESTLQTREDVQRIVDRHGIAADLFDDDGRLVATVRPR